MGKRKRHSQQSSMWVATQDLPHSAAHPFYARLNQILDQHDFDGFVEGRDAVYRNRRVDSRSAGLRLLRLRGERLERPFAHLYETGGLRRVYLRGHTNIRRRLLIHASGFNLGLLMRQLIGVGTPRGLQGRVAAVLVALLTLIRTLSDAITWRHRSPARLISRLERLSIASKPVAQIGERRLAFTTGC